MNKIINIGVVDLGGSKGGQLFCSIELKEGRLSISGVEAPLPSGNARGSCGQIVMHEWNFKKLHKGWTPALVSKFRKTWDKYHLNDMKAGSPRQELAINAWKLGGATYEYKAACEMLAQLGLLEDQDYIHAGKLVVQRVIGEAVEDALDRCLNRVLDDDGAHGGGRAVQQ